MNVAMAAGIFCGIVVGLVLVTVGLNFARKKGTKGCQFDERQQLVRGKGFKAAFFTLMIYNLVYGLLEAVMDTWPIEHLTGNFIGVCLGVLVYAAYSIWNDGYFALNENPKRVLLLFFSVAVLNLAIAGRNISKGSLIENGSLSNQSLNLVCGVMFILLFLILCAKRLISKGDGE